jgi:serine/threonine protein kinase
MYFPPSHSLEASAVKIPLLALKSDKEIKALGVVHEDFRPDNVLWNEELGRALIIDFHRSTLRCRPVLKRPRAKRQLLRTGSGDAKRLRVL